MEELYVQRITSSRDVTPRVVRDILRRLKLRKTYEHVAQITSKITGRPALCIPVEAEEMCRLMFIAVQPIFDKVCPKERKNFLSYAYIRAPLPHSPALRPLSTSTPHARILQSVRLLSILRNLTPSQSTSSFNCSDTTASGLLQLTQREGQAAKAGCAHRLTRTRLFSCACTRSHDHTTSCRTSLNSFARSSTGNSSHPHEFPEAVQGVLVWFRPALAFG